MMACGETIVKINSHIGIFILIAKWSPHSDSSIKIFPVKVQIKTSLLFIKDGRSVMRNA